VLPGGESTTMTLGIQREGLGDPLRALAASGTPILGTCAGMIILDREHLGILDIVAQRNAFGRQLRSFESDLDIPGVPGGPVHAVFIRAPWVAEAGPGCRRSPRSMVIRLPSVRATSSRSHFTRS
jgi:5'-phosphate synthase pdxT subunit